MIKTCNLIMLACLLVSQPRTTTYDLPKLLSENKLEIENRVASPDGAGIRLSAADGDGVAWIRGVNFSDGTIEVDLKGKNTEQKSFLGIAFHGIDVNTLDAIYFRPFNFRSADSAKRIHMVEYVSHPNYTWQVLREKYSGQYEKGLPHPPNPDGWFHVRIEVRYPMVSVFVDKDTQPCLTVRQLDMRRSGKIGLWVGNTADGHFAHLQVKPAK